MVLEGKCEKEGFCLTYKNRDFKCAFITQSSQYAYGKVSLLKKHRESDEVFSLIEGEAKLLTGEPSQEKYEIRKLVKGVSYCVTADTWHYLAVSADALVFVVENSEVSAANTDVIAVDEQELYVDYD